MNWLSFVFSVITSLPSIIADVEHKNPTLPGEGKKVLVLDQINTAIKDADPIYGPLIANHPSVQAAVSTATDALVDLANQSAAVAAANAQAHPSQPVPQTIGEAQAPAPSAPVKA